MRSSRVTVQIQIVLYFADVVCYSYAQQCKDMHSADSSQALRIAGCALWITGALSVITVWAHRLNRTRSVVDTDVPRMGLPVRRAANAVDHMHSISHRLSGWTQPGALRVAGISFLVALRVAGKSKSKGHVRMHVRMC